MAALAQVSFVVFFLGPPLLGFVAEHLGIRLSYLIVLPVILAGLLLTGLARRRRAGWQWQRPMPELPPIVDLRQSPTALRMQRGVMRLLRDGA